MLCIKAALDILYVSCWFGRNFVERCRQCDSLGSTDSLDHAHSSLETIVNQSTKVLTDRLFDNIRVRDVFTRISSPGH